MRATDRVEATVIACAAVAVGVVLWSSRSLPAEARQFPIVIGSALLGLLILQLIVTVLRRGPEHSSNTEGALGDVPDADEELILDFQIGAGRSDREVLRGIVEFSMWLGAFFLAIYFLGFRWGGVGMLLLYTRVGLKEKWIGTLAIGAGALVLLYVSEEFLQIPFPRGYG
jgi:hypothetical protein